MIKPYHHKILVIHGPNMNLIGLRKRKDGGRITLDKLNRHLQQTAIELGISLTIFQTNDESRAVKHLQVQRKKIKGILLFPGPWQQSGHVIKDTLEILSIPCITISLGEKTDVLKGIKNIDGADIYKSLEQALTTLTRLI
tara:strand:+ start:212 stop:631 length:420 start_codon:yes stop_codon:yes gene_type:complete